MNKFAPFFSILLILGLTAFQCENGQDCCVPPPPCSSVNSLNGTWKLDYYLDMVTGQTELDPQPESRGVIYTFSGDQTKGKIDGHTVVNTIAGTYDIGTDCAFKINVFGGTKVNEPAWSRKAWFAPDRYYLFEIAGDKLSIKPDNSQELMVFKRVK